MPHAYTQEDYKRLLGIFDAIVSSLIVVDGNGLIREANAAARALLGEDCRGAHYAGLFRFQKHDPVAACLASGESQHRVEAIGEGKRIWGITSSTLTLDGGEHGAVIGFRDLTELKKMEEALAASEREAIVGRMAATVAHEVNNPLGAIKAHLRLLKKTLNESEEMRTIEIVSQQVDRIARTVQNLLGFSRHRSSPAESVSLSEVMKTVIDLFEETFREKEIHLASRIAPDLPRTTANADQIQEVLVNLLENARDALPRGARLTIDASSAGRTVKIIFEDNGPGLGIEPEKNFDPFYTTKTKGTGLGLTIARRICESHGGSLVAENSPVTGGARFTILLPAT